MPAHVPTPGQLERLEAALLGVRHTTAAIADAEAALALALAEDADARQTLVRAIASVLYGPGTGGCLPPGG